MAACVTTGDTPLRIGELNLTRVLGRGAYGEVIAATYHGTRVVLKVVPYLEMTIRMRTDTFLPLHRPGVWHANVPGRCGCLVSCLFMNPRAQNPDDPFIWGVVFEGQPMRRHGRSAAPPVLASGCRAIASWHPYVTTAMELYSAPSPPTT